MRHFTRDYLADRDRALRAALVLARLGGWQLDEQDFLMRSVRDARYEPVADFLLAPFGANQLTAVERQLRTARCDAVLVSTGRTNAGDATLYVTIALWRASGVTWHHGLRLWFAPGDEAFWLVADPDGETRDGPSFRLARARLRPLEERPWSDVIGRDAGLAAANARVAALMASIERAETW